MWAISSEEGGSRPLFWFLLHVCVHKNHLGNMVTRQTWAQAESLRGIRSHCCSRRSERTVTPQVMGESLGRVTKWESLASLRKEFKSTQRWNRVYLQRYTLRRTKAAQRHPTPGCGAWLVFMGWVISYANEWEELCRGRGGDFQELSQRPLFGVLYSALELSWLWWVCLVANVLQWVYNEAQGLLEVKFSDILGLTGSNPFLFYA